MRKLLIAFLSVLAISCLGAFFACTKGGNTTPNYYTLIYSGCDGAEIECEIPSTYDVKSGYTVRFTLNIDESASGEPVVTRNGSTLTPDKNGVYSFKMDKDSTIAVSGIQMPNEYTVTFDKEDNRIEFIVDDGALNGNVNDGYKVVAGTEISFQVKISSYYKDEYEVYANTQKITPDSYGVYTFYALGNNTVKVSNLELADTFIDRGDGSGTSADPYLIKTPSDLYAMFAYINSDFYGAAFNSCSYRLENDIDMKGEQIYTIADGYSSTNAVFYGTFDGNDKTISNFTIDGTFLDQESYDDINIPYVGLFGFVMSTDGYTAGIYNLHLDSYTITADTSVFDYSDYANTGVSGAYVGAIAGFAAGATISGCTATNGTITIKSHSTYAVSFVGGIVGYFRSYTDSTTNIGYYGVVSYCHSDAKIENTVGYCYAIGGIAGIVGTGDENVNAFVINSYFTGEAAGAFSVGGIVGYMSGYTSVVGCYSTGEVEATSTIAKSGSGADYDTYCYAYAGGIVGYASYDTVVADCFALKNITYANAEAGSDYAFTGDIIGYIYAAQEMNDPTNASSAVIYNCKSDTKVTNSMFKNTLKWDSADWSFGADGDYPTTNTEAATKSFTITISLGENTINGKNTYSVTRTDAYDAMSSLYYGTLDEYLVADNGYRSFGYFFDSELTQAVPYGFVPTRDITLYAGFADYSLVAGKYYFVSNYSNGAYILLQEDGTLCYYNGAMSLETKYTFDGTNIMLINTAIAQIEFSAPVAEPDSNATTEESMPYYRYVYATSYYYSFLAKVEGDVMTITDKTFYTDGATFKALKESDTFTYGSYYNGDVTVTFTKYGTGSIGSAAFTYVIDGSTITATATGAVYTFTIGNGTVTKEGTVYTALDAYVGTWEAAATTNAFYTFDGKGNYTYNSYGVNANGEKVNEVNTSGTYTVANDRLTAATFTAFINSDGFLTIDDVVFYRENSFAGTWSYEKSGYPVELQLDGIGSEGFGTGIMTLGNSQTSYNVTYGTYTTDGVVYVNVYYYQSLMASLYYTPADKTLRGVAGSSSEGMIFCVYDEFMGEWISDDDDIATVEFNGLGMYNIREATSLNRRGEVYVTAKDGTQSEGTYTLTNQTLSGSFTIGSYTYAISYDRTNNKIVVTKSATTVDLTVRDAWYAISLKDGDGNVYTFDGRGNLTGGGTMTKTSQDGKTVTTATYKVTTSGLTLSGAIAGTIAEDTANNNYALTVSGAKTALTYANSFSGTWVVSGRRINSTILSDAESTVISVGEFGLDKQVAGTFMGEAVTFSYNLEDNYVSFVYKTYTLYLNAFGSGNSAELALGATNDLVSDYLICIPQSEVDELAGKTYTAADGSTITFDGLGNSFHGSGYAYIVDGGQLAGEYNYSFATYNGKKIIEFRDSSSYIYVFAEVGEASDISFADENGKNYEIIQARYAFYLLKAYFTDMSAMTFDGIGHAFDEDGHTYTYTVDGYDGESRTYTLTMIREDNVEYTADVDFSAVITYITMGLKSLNADTTAA